MVIMALDHTRDYFHNTAMTADPLDPATTNTALYFTRWITHFCAPTFVFLSGVSAYLASLKRSKNEASLFLIKRGLWLMIAEMVIVTFGISYNPFFNAFVWQVIWVIGCSMVLLGIVSRISRNLVLILGLILFFGHNILDYLKLPQEGVSANLLSIFLRFPTVMPIDESHRVLVLYAILPWTGVMFMGYSIGHWFKAEFPAERRRKFLLSIGIGMIVLFIILRATNLYGNPFPWVKGEGFRYNLFSFLNTSKYPPSLQYLCMTLGPACLLLVLFEKVKSRFTDLVSVYGQVPFFYYVLHFYFLHLILVIFFFAEGYNTSQIEDPRLFFPLFFRPLEFGYDLPVVYLIWISVVIILYFPCRWFARYKKTHRQWWLSYV